MVRLRPYHPYRYRPQVELLETRATPALINYGLTFAKGGSGGDRGEAVATDAAGDVFVAGRFNGTVNFGGTSLTATGPFDSFVAKYNSAGVLSWAHRMGNGSSQADGIAVDATGNVYVSDGGNNRVRKITPDGIIRTIAGNSTPLFQGTFGGDGGPATAAGLNLPQGLAVDGAGNLYIADYGNARIRKIDSAGIITTVVGK